MFIMDKGMRQLARWNTSLIGIGVFLLILTTACKNNEVEQSADKVKSV